MEMNGRENERENGKKCKRREKKINERERN